MTMEAQYLQVMRQILGSGVEQRDRTGTGTLEVWGPQISCDLADGFPILTTKEVRWRKAIAELAWMMYGHTNTSELHKLGVKYWDKWADEKGDLGPVYGAQWRKWRAAGAGGFDAEIDQLAAAINTLTNNPTCRRIIVSAWNVGEVPDMRLPPCHLYYQFNVQNGRLNTMAVMRSADWFLGVPFNIVMYAALTHIVAYCTDLQPGRLVMNFGSAHLYLNHLDQAREQLTRDPFPMPEARLESFFDHPDALEAAGGDADLLFELFQPKHFELLNYSHHPFIAAEVSA